MTRPQPQHYNNTEGYAKALDRYIDHLERYVSEMERQLIETI